MKLFTNTLLALITIGTPSSMAVAQASDADRCYQRCDQIFYTQYDFCYSRYGSSWEGEWCINNASQEFQGCWTQCNNEFNPASFNPKPKVDRWKPTEINKSNNIS